MPMLFGIGLMLLGLVFAGIEARWRGELRRWLLSDLAVLLIYASALAGLLRPQAFWLTGLAAVYYLLGNALLAPAGGRLASLPEAMGDLLLSVFELTINTLSFLRVGAFALAHAALSHAVLSLADAVESVWLQGLIITGRQRLLRGHGRPAGVRADHPAGAVRVLHPLPAGGRTPCFGHCAGRSRKSAAPGNPSINPSLPSGGIYGQANWATQTRSSMQDDYAR